ncbi:unnamed protein product [Sphagnum jensenii]|uniref:Alcohol dehydrogenase-like N-terminal domain-containing protein n=1 Tax=Sphagnum jensenii TaxID=128206 RepID=A0ABP1AQF9_9BRYO
MANRTQVADHRKNSEQLELVSSSSFVTIKHRNGIFLRFFCFGLWDPLRFLYKLALNLSPRQEPSSLFSFFAFFFFFYSLRSVAGGSKVSILQRENGYQVETPQAVPVTSTYTVLQDPPILKTPTCTITSKKDEKHKMRAVEYHGKRNMKVRERPRPLSHGSGNQETLEDANKLVSHEPSSFSQLSMQENTQIIALLDAISDLTDAILSITTTCICGSDLHMYVGFMPGVKPGDVMGHEFMGIVESVGSECALVHGAARVVLIDSVQYHLDFAKKKLKDILTINWKDKEVYKEVWSIFPQGPDVAIEAVGFHYVESLVPKLETTLNPETDTSEIVNEIIYTVCKAGRVSIVGVYAGFAKPTLLPMVQSGKIDSTLPITRVLLKPGMDRCKVTDRVESVTESVHNTVSGVAKGALGSTL